MKDTERHDIAVATKLGDEYFIGINEVFLIEAIQEQETSKLSTLTPNQHNAKLAFLLAHEMAHLRQDQRLDYDFGDATTVEPLLSETARDYIIRMQGELVGRNTIDFMGDARYESNVRETHANAVATRYIASKREDSNATQFWQDLDITPFLNSKWTSITEALKRKKLSQLITLQSKQRELVENSPELPILQKRENILQKSLSTIEYRNTQAVSKITQ